jgi:hypothetical protein
MAVPNCNSSRRIVPHPAKSIVDRLRAYRSQSSIPQSENERPAVAAVLPFAVKAKTKRRKSHWKAAAIIRRLRSYRSDDRAFAAPSSRRKVVSFPADPKRGAR